MLNSLPYQLGTSAFILSKMFRKSLNVVVYNMLILNPKLVARVIE